MTEVRSWGETGVSVSVREEGCHELGMEIDDGDS